MPNRSLIVPRQSRRAFSVVEVMFAVMILGIGFIMVAAIFPVGIQQGRDAVDETTGRAISKQSAYSAASVIETIAADRNIAQRDTNLGAIAVACGPYYLWAGAKSPTPQYTLGTTTITNAGNTGTIGGGTIYLEQMIQDRWQYMGQNDYLSQTLYSVSYNVPMQTGKMTILSLALRDARAQADAGTPLNTPYVYQLQVAFDSKANIYSNVYLDLTTVKDMGGNAVTVTDNQMSAFLGTRGTIVLGQPGSKPIRLSDNPPTVLFAPTNTPPPGLTWAPAWIISTSVPVVGSFTVTASLP